MTVKDVFELRKKGRIEEAYEAIRPMYAADKGAYTSLAMFWTATDVLKKRLSEGRNDEAKKIFMALERMQPNVPDNDGWVHKAFETCRTAISRKDAAVAHHEAEPNHLQMGDWGEALAAEYLRKKGYVILWRDWRSGHRDIDIIAQQDDTTVFVEVKTRRSRDFTEPLSAVDSKKQRNLLYAINHYVQSHHINGLWRFDVITIVGELGSTNPDIEHIEDFHLAIPFKSGGRYWRR